jgi:DNA (cytosine-5)-methyltransferase 1
VPNHVAAAVSGLNLKRLRSTPHDGGDRRTWPQRLQLECHSDHDGHTDVYGRMAWDKPAPTLTGRCNSISNGRYGHPCQDRALSLREAASLQTFGDDYIFYGENQPIARAIGNAVPVGFAECLGRHILALRYGNSGHKLKHPGL